MKKEDKIKKTAVNSKIRREIVEETYPEKKEEFNLSEKMLMINKSALSDMHAGYIKRIYLEEDVKEKIQNVQRRLKEKKKMKFNEGRAYIGIWWIDKIFLEEFGEKLLEEQKWK